MQKLGLISALFISSFLLIGCNQTTMDTTTDTTDTAKLGAISEEKSDTQTENRIAVIETNMGTMEIELYEQRAPITTKNFIDLSEKGYYDGLKFHRVIEGFMIQGGDPNGDGSGGPGYSIEDEFHLELTHSKAGILSMANSGPNSGGSQFFITLAATSWLDGKHAVFGEVVKGEDVLKKIGNVETAPGDKPLEDIIMEKVTIK